MATVSIVHFRVITGQEPVHILLTTCWTVRKAKPLHSWCSHIVILYS